MSPPFDVALERCRRVLRRDGRREETMFLTADHVSYTYNRRTRVEEVSALRDLSVEVARGSLTGLIGPNGCGKTTLLKLLAGVLAPDSGSVALDGRTLGSMSRRHA